MVLWLISIPPHYRQHRTLAVRSFATPISIRANLAALGVSAGFYAMYTLALELLCTLGFFAVAAVLLWRRSDERMALLVALFLVALGAGYPGTLYGLEAIHPAFSLATRGVDKLGLDPLRLCCYLFPDGRFVPRWTRWPAIAWSAALTLDVFLAGSPFASEHWPPLVFLLVTLGAFGTWVFGQAYRYRRVSGPTQRQQTKWVALGMTAAIGGFTVLVLSSLVSRRFGQPGTRYDLISTPAVIICFLAVPLSLLLAILRYRLYDIDLLINRALVYGALSATLALVYGGSVLLLQQLVRALTGQSPTSPSSPPPSPSPRSSSRCGGASRPSSTAASTAASTTPRAIVATFGATLRDETNLEQLHADLLAVVEETMQPAQVSLWLRPQARHAEGEQSGP